SATTGRRKPINTRASPQIAGHLARFDLSGPGFLFPGALRTAAMMSFAVSIETAEFCRSSSSKLCGPADWDSESLLHMSPPQPPRAGKARGEHRWRHVRCPAMRKIIRTAAGTAFAIEAAKTRAGAKLQRMQLPYLPPDVRSCITLPFSSFTRNVPPEGPNGGAADF